MDKAADKSKKITRDGMSERDKAEVVGKLGKKDAMEVMSKKEEQDRAAKVDKGHDGLEKVENQTEQLFKEKTEEKPKGTPRRSRSWKKEVFSFIREFVFALIVSLLITRFVFIIPLVPTGSMIPTININERILVDKLTRYFSPIKRGEIVVFPCPDNPEELYVKRVIGMAGETVTIRDNAVYINGVALDEPYITVDMIGADGPYQVPEGHIFVLGDNRNSSKDSRRWVTTNYVNLADVQGRGVAILWPLNQIRWLK